MTATGDVLGNTGIGVRLGPGANGNTVGGTAEGTHNTISGSGASGVSIIGSDNKVLGNDIGTDPDGGGGNVFSNNAEGVVILSGSGNIIGGKTKSAKNIIAGNGSIGVSVQSSGNFIGGNLIGLNKDGAAKPNIRGISLSGSASNNNIYQNFISGNATCGIELNGSGVGNNVIEHNYLGLKLAFSGVLGNGVNGIVLSNGAHDNTIGGSGKAGNTVAGGSGAILSIDGKDNTVVNNFLGTEETGKKSGYGELVGVLISSNDSSGNMIGGTTTALRNVISGNQIEVSLWGHENTVQANYIGLDATGKVALANTTDGLLLSGNINSILKNVISGNQGNGISGNGDTISLIQGNFIGTDSTGKKDLHNMGNGITLKNSTSAMIGGLKKGDSNVVAFNSGIGINLDGGSSNLIEANSIFNHGSLGISLTNNANGGQVAPVITAAGKVAWSSP